MTAKTAPKLGRRKTDRVPENPITLYPAWCKRCGLCIAFCPKSVYDAAPDGGPVVARPQDCIHCHLCELRCPDFAVSVADYEEETR